MEKIDIKICQKKKKQRLQVYQKNYRDSQKSKKKP